MSSSSDHHNRLSGESSPYLRLHRHNPVDWYPWGEEALARAAAEDMPIFLSVGYSTCYWCHVMERESFSDPQIAAFLNEHFVNIKVDREERPDIDEIYMTATQVLAGQGGWPNSLFLTPELKPFFAGTYFPPEDRYGRPGFPRLIDSLASAWRDRREDIEEQAESVTQATRQYLERRQAPRASGGVKEIVEQSFLALTRRFDQRCGGFGGAPKFPTPANLMLLAEFAEERTVAAEMLDATLDQMARGGIFDQLGGGFHRYATDREWKIPHFEKMLYDNGLLLGIYAGRYRQTRDAEAERVLRHTVSFMERELLSPEGGWWSAVDAETGGREGAFYVWTEAELRNELGEEDFAFLAPLFGFDGPAFFEEHHYVLHLPQSMGEQAERRRISPAVLWDEIEPLRRRLLSARERRPRPLTDDKVLTDWNGMAIAGLVEAGGALGEARWIELASSAAEFILEALRDGETLLHAWHGGHGKVPAFLADYAFLVRGLLALHRATGVDRWLERAESLTRQQADRLGDAAGGFFVAAESADVLARSKEIFDGAVPAANGVAILNLLELAERTGEPQWRAQAKRALDLFGGFVAAQPEAAQTLAVAMRRLRMEPDGRSVSAVLSLGEASDGWSPFRLSVEIASGWHIYAHRPGSEHAVPTVLEAKQAELRGVDYPRGLAEAASGAEVFVYEGRVVLSGEVRSSGAAEGGLVLRYQACDATRCLAPDVLDVALA